MSSYNWDDNEDFIEQIMKHFGKFRREMLSNFKNLMDGIELKDIKEMDDDFEVKRIEGPGIRGFIARRSFRYPADPSQGDGSPTLPRPTRPVPREPFPIRPDRREPFAELIEEGNRLIVVAEVPGVEKEDIKIDLTNRGLEIDAGNRFYKEIQLPTDVDFDKVEANCSNGILEIRIPKKEKQD
ncbi:MAG: Hsp20/alpha crystallin family protein [Candidatus Hodarchaeota archaeon]